MEIFVRNIADEVEEQDLYEIFGEYGAVESVTLVMDKKTGRRMGFGFVKMPSTDEAITAMNALKDVVLKDQMLELHESRTHFERRENPERRANRRDGRERRTDNRRKQNLVGVGSGE